MEKIICPFCKEHYQVKKLVEYKRFICGKCGRKHIYCNGRLVPFSFRNSRTETVRIESCAYCKNGFMLEDNASGEYICPFCNNVLYILPPSGEMPGDAPKEPPHELDTPNPPESISRTAAIPNPGASSPESSYIEEPRRSIDIRKLPPPPGMKDAFGRQPSSGKVDKTE